MSMPMRERIWRTIQQENLDAGLPPINNKNAARIADAVLDALMEPTEGMVTAALLRPGEDEAWRKEWAAAIQAARDGK